MLRKITSLTALLSFLVTLITSVVLYIEPHGRVAYWADWTFLGLPKDDWDAIHLTMGTLFLAAILLHLWLNWKPLMAYMKDKARRLVVMTVPMLVGAAITLFVFVGTLAGWPPMQQILDFGASVKDSATRTYGNPPYGHAELSPLDKFCAYLGMDAEKAAEALRKAGYTLEQGAATEIRSIARSRGVSPQRVFEDMRGARSASSAASPAASPAVGPTVGLPADPPQGLGRMTLREVCATYGLPVEDAVARLKARSVNADPELTLKDIAAGAGMKPRDLYAVLRGE